ncbi:hypothetical protein GGR57DRAFT_307648 [Xylariaceae sp. FL1272]|nr:hypothetical protein GGR57DRAFT_307648 [Xylariaceae sp. FL1272]
MRIAIHIGVWTTLVVCLTSIIVTTLIIVPHNGQPWNGAPTPRSAIEQISIYWGISWSSAVTLIDTYIVILPIPSLWRLRMSTRRRIQITAVFLVGVIAVVASTTSLVFNIYSISSQLQRNDYTYWSAVISFLILIEMNASLIIPCSVSFARMMRYLVSQISAWTRPSPTSRGRHMEMRHNPTDSPYRHPALRDPRSNHRGAFWKTKGAYSEMSDAWLMSNGTVDIERYQRLL